MKDKDTEKRTRRKWTNRWTKSFLLKRRICCIHSDDGKWSYTHQCCFSCYTPVKELGCTFGQEDYADGTFEIKVVRFATNSRWVENQQK